MALGPDEIAILSTAYEDALRVLKLTDRQDPITELVAAKIIKVARLYGATSPETIREQALKELGIAPQSPSSDGPQSGTREPAPATESAIR